MNKDDYVALIAASIILVPLSGVFPMFGANIWYVQYLALLGVFCIYASLALWKFNKYLSIFIWLCLISVIFVSGNPTAIAMWKLNFIQQHPKSILTLIQIVGACFAIYGISKLNRQQRRIIQNAIIMLFVIQGLWVVLQSLNLDPIFNHIKSNALDDTVGFTGSHNQIGLFFASVSPLIFARMPYLLSFVVYGLWNSTTSFAWAGSAMGVLFYQFSKDKKIFIQILIILTIASVIFFSQYESLNSVVVGERLTLWKHTIGDVLDGDIDMVMPKVIQGKTFKVREIQKCNPLFGYGLGNFQRYSPYSQGAYIKSTHPDKRYHGDHHIYLHAHNDYIETFFDLGIFGFISLLAIIGNLFYRFCRAIKTKELLIYFSCVLAHMITALGIFTVHTAASGMMLILFLGLLEGELREQGRAIKWVRCLRGTKES